jgi:hypothetical protein
MSHHNRVFRLGATLLGVTCTGLGCYGAYELALKLEGQMSYLVIAAPVVAAAAAFIPPMAEQCWKQRQRLKAVLWFLVLLPTAATVFFASAERVHDAKAGAEAERQAHRSAAARATQEFTDVKAELATTGKAADPYRKRKADECIGKCATALSAESRAKERFSSAETALLKAEAKATTESALKAPVWLLPASLDLVAFMAIWSGMTGPAVPQQRGARADKVRVLKKKKTTKPRAKVGTAPQPAKSKLPGILSTRLRWPRSKSAAIH